MKQPENDHTKMFGNDGPIGNDAEIVVYYEQHGPAEPVLRIPFWYYKEELGMYEHFEASVHRTAKALKESYTYWPEGYIHVQTIINDDVWSQVWSIDCIEQAKHYVHTKRDNGKQYRIVKHTTEVL
jgi:hypothetical protein